MFCIILLKLLIRCSRVDYVCNDNDSYRQQLNVKVHLKNSSPKYHQEPALNEKIVPMSSVTRLGDFLHFGLLVKAFGQQLMFGLF